MALNVVLKDKNESKKPAVIELKKDGNDVDILVDGNLIAFFNGDGILNVCYHFGSDADNLIDAGFALEGDENDGFKLQVSA